MFFDGHDGLARGCDRNPTGRSAFHAGPPAAGKKASADSDRISFWIERTVSVSDTCLRAGGEDPKVITAALLLLLRPQHCGTPACTAAFQARTGGVQHLSQELITPIRCTSSTSRRNRFASALSGAILRRSISTRPASTKETLIRCRQKAMNHRVHGVTGTVLIRVFP